jgi:hypothetical protein
LHFWRIKGSGGQLLSKLVRLQKDRASERIWNVWQSMRPSGMEG